MLPNKVFVIAIIIIVVHMTSAAEFKVALRGFHQLRKCRSRTTWIISLFQTVGWENMAFVFLNRYLDLVEVSTAFIYEKQPLLVGKCIANSVSILFLLSFFSMPS